MLIDAFIFYNELELLELRLNELKDCVDLFVLIESTHTHQGQLKPLYFEENRNKFSQFHIHSLVTPPRTQWPVTRPETWGNEYEQRKWLASALTWAKDDDLLLWSDVDEIPAPRDFRQLAGVNPITRLAQKHHYYYLNCLAVDQPWYGTVLSTVGQLRQMDGQRLAMERANRQLSTVDCGWHFSFLGGPQRIKQKLMAYTHTEYSGDEYTNPEYLSDKINKGEDIFGRDFKYRFIEIDQGYPKYLRDNLDKFSHLIKSL